MTDNETSPEDELEQLENKLDGGLEDNGENSGEESDGTSARKPSPFENPVPDTRMGHVTAAGEGLKIGRDENTLYAALYSEAGDEIQVDDYIRIPYYQPDKIDDINDDVEVKSQLLATVKSLSYATHLDDKRITTSDTFGAEQYSYLAELEPISLIELDENWVELDEPFVADFVSIPPRPTVRVDKISNNEFLRCGLDIPSDGIYVGDMAVNGDRIPNVDDPLEYYLFNPNAETDYDGEPTIFRHVLVAGSTGTGKTHTSKNILRQYAQPLEYEIDVPANDPERENRNTRTRKLNITIIDPEEEYAQMGDDPVNQEDRERIEEFSESRIGLQYGGIGGETDFNVYAPITGDSNLSELDTQGSEVHEFGIPFEIVNYHRKLMMPNNPGGPTIQAISEILGDYFSEAQGTPTYEGFKNWYDITKRTEYTQESKFNESIVDAAERRLFRNEYDDVFDKTSTSLTDADFVEDMFAEGQVSVITTGHLRNESQNLVIQAIASHIVENKVSSDIPEKYTPIKGTPLVMALDEAHEYVNEPSTTREEFIIDKFRRAARRGRKDKFGLYFISQDPEDIDGEVRNQLNTKIYLQLKERVAKSPDVYIPNEFRSRIAQFKKGQMMVDQPGVNPVELQGLDTCLTKHTK